MNELNRRGSRATWKLVFPKTDEPIEAKRRQPTSAPPRLSFAATREILMNHPFSRLAAQ